MKLRNVSALLLIVAALALPGVASAHVTVKPAQVGIGSFTTYTISVPNEKDVDMTGLKLLVPATLGEVTPTVKSGWTITPEKTGETTTAITWAGGTIPAGFRDDFSFSAQAPAKATNLNWKAYQTYADGTTVSWDQNPSSSEKESDTSGPYSVTEVVNDLTTRDTAVAPKNNDTLAIVISSLALLLAFGALILKKRS